MQKFRDLYIKVDSHDTAAFIAALGAILTAGWTRAHETEEEARDVNPDEECFYYCCDKRGGREAAMVAIYRRDAETLYVSNVVPTESSELSPDQYNGILQDFHETLLTELRPAFTITFMLASDQLRLDHMMSPDAFKKLRAFSAAANKSTGSAHPQDRKRWYAFLITLHRGNQHLDAHSLFRWLTEVEQWPPDVAQKLAIEFEFAMGLLAHSR